MATKKVNIDIIAKDKTRMAMATATRGVNNLKNSVFNLKVAFAALGVGLVARDFVNTAREIERLKVRFKFLFDTAAEGEKAFKGLIKFAGEVPFTLDEIQRGSANLAVVAKDADELNEILRITGDIAAASGLDFQTTAEQIQRTFSAGINSADLFRERGVRELLGFEAGVAISAEKSKQHIIDAFRDGTIAVKGASLEMAETFDGVMSMISDKFLQFKIALMDAGPFDLLKANAILVEETLGKSFETIEDAALFMGDRIVEAFKAIVLGVAGFIDTFRPAINFVFGSFNTLSRFVNSVPPVIASIGILGFLALGTKGRLVVIAIAGVYNKIQDIFREMMEFVKSSTDVIASAVKKLGFDETANQITKFGEAIENMTPKVVDNIEDMKESFEEFGHMSIMKLFGTDDIESLSGDMKKLAEEYLRNLDLIMSNRLKEHDVVSAEGKDDIEKTITLMDKLRMASEGFKEGFKEAMKEAGNIQKNFTQIGKESFKELTDALTNFVMTGKLSVEDLARTIIKQIVNALVGAAVSSAIEKGKKMFQMKAIKEGLISVYQGALKTFGSIPFPFNILAVGAAIKFGMGLVNKIRGFEKGGRPAVGQPAIVGEAGPELFIPDQAGTVVPNNQLGMGGKPVTVNFNINTVDARGFNELLVNSRGVIVNIINQAVNEKGKMAVI
tara:strand:- start:6832 stop:8850 length:2019 start_codon:yes stop_codon:yes gene_type:complete